MPTYCTVLANSIVGSVRCGVSDVASRFAPSVVLCIPDEFIAPGDGATNSTEASMSSTADLVSSHPVERAVTAKASTETSKE